MCLYEYWPKLEQISKMKSKRFRSAFTSTQAECFLVERSGAEPKTKDTGAVYFCDHMSTLLFNIHSSFIMSNIHVT